MKAFFKLKKMSIIVTYILWGNKASWPTMRPQACMIIICAFWVLHSWLILSQRFLLAGVEIHGEMRDFLLFWRKRDQMTDRRTDWQTQTLLQRCEVASKNSRLWIKGETDRQIDYRIQPISLPFFYFLLLLYQ